jgi:hypothetical protein
MEQVSWSYLKKTQIKHRWGRCLKGCIAITKQKQNVDTLHYTILIFSPMHSSWGPLHTRDWEPVTSTLQALSLVEKAEPVQLRFALRLRDHQSMWMQDGCKVYMDSYMTSNGSCFTITWTNFKNHFLEVGPTQNQETMALQTLTTIGLFYFVMCEDLHE